MLLQTNSYIVPKDKRAEHARLLKRFRQTLARLGCDHFEAYEQVGSNWNSGRSTGRFVQIMRFRDRRHHQQVQASERTDQAAQDLIREFCDLINFPYQQEQSLFAVGFYTSALPIAAAHAPAASAGVVDPTLEEVIEPMVDGNGQALSDEPQADDAAQDIFATTEEEAAEQIDAVDEEAEPREPGGGGR